MPGGTGIVLGAVAVFLLVSGAWAYQEVTRKPPPVPADDARIPPPATEPLSAFFPAQTAVYGRLSLTGPVTAFIQHGLSGFGLGAVLEGIPVTRYILPGLNAMMGYPLYFDGEGELTLENHDALLSGETRQLLGEIMSEAEGDAVLGIYPAERGEAPFHASMAVRLKNPGLVRTRLAELQRSFRGSSLFEGFRVDGEHLWVTSAPRVERAWWKDLSRDPAFKRTMANLPGDRFATVYVNGPSLKRVSEAYERYLQGGEELGSEILGLAGGMVGDPATKALLTQLDQEGFTGQHLGTAATFRLGILQGHTHSDWTPKDPDGLRARAEAVMRASTARSQQLLGP